MVGATVRRTHRLTRALKNSVPPVRQWFPETETALFGDVLGRWPPRTAAQRARRTTLEDVCRAPHGRSAEVLTTRLPALTRAMARTTAAGVIPPTALLGHALVAHLRVTWPALADVDTAIAQRAQGPPDFPWFHALPGAGAVCAPRLLVACGAPRERHAAAEARQKDAGIAPGTARRGKTAWVHWRFRCPTCLRHTCVAWAAASIRPACWARVYSPQQRDQGTAPQAAVRALACKGLRMLFRWWQERTPSNASVSLTARNRRGASLLHNLAQAAEKSVKRP